MQHTTLDKRLWGRWTATFVGFPLAGLAANAAAGRIDSLGAAALGGTAAGLALGAVQSLARSRKWATRIMWAAATAAGFGSGLALGASAVGYRTDTASLVVMGALSGSGVGIAQAIALDGSLARRVAWAPLTAALWAAGWLITAQVIDTDRQWANFGASAAVVVSAIGGLLLATRRSTAVSRTPLVHAPMAMTP